MEPLNLEDPDPGFERRLLAFRRAADNSNFDAAFVADTQAAIANYSDKDLKAMVTMHLLFTDDAPMETMEGFWFGKRLAAELLAGRR